MVRCGQCDGEVIMALTDRGKLVPLQPEPDPGGRLAVREGPDGKPYIRYLRGQETATGAEVRMAAHWDYRPSCRPPRRRNRGAAVAQLAAVR